MRPPRGVPRDEWLLAIGLANAHAGRYFSNPAGLVIDAIDSKLAARRLPVARVVR